MRDLDVLWRRIAAYFFDYLVIAFFAVFLGLITISLGEVLSLGSIDTAFKGHLVGFFTLTLPALLYFSKTESSIKQASFGKRIFGLKVESLQGSRPDFKLALTRAVVLLLPWELAHIGIWYGAENPFIEAPALWALMLMIAAQIILLLYLITAIFAPTRALHDKIAGLAVVKVQPCSSNHFSSQ